MSIEHTRFVDQSNAASVVPSTLTWEQLEPGTLDVAYQTVPVGPLFISSRAFNLALHASGQLAPNKSGIMLIEPGADASWRGSPFDVASIAVGTEIDVRMTGASVLFGIALDQRDLQRHLPDSLDACDLGDELGCNKVARKLSASARLRHAVKSLCTQQGILPPAASATLIALLVAALDETDGHSVERSLCLNRRYAAVRACEIYMREHIDATVTLLDLSRACGMRSRSLINAFQAITGFSPMDYLKRLRLSSARNMLLRADARSTLVIDIAMEWGFWHMGHFARDYRAMFGETPSQTLRHT